MSQTLDLKDNSLPCRRTRWRRRLKWMVVWTLALIVVVAFVLKDYVRTLASLRRVPGTNGYVMDYYVNYHLDEVRSRGVEVDDLEGSFINALLPDFAVPIANRVKRRYIPSGIETLESSEGMHHCSTVAMKSEQGQVFFGRNFDYGNDAYLILRVHDRGGLASISVSDLAYLNLNRTDLDQTTLLERLPLLFAPFYLMDGMNRHGVAVSDMAVPVAKPPVTPGKPAIIQSTLMRLILDHAKTSDDAVELVREFNVHFVEVPEHLMVADASGNFRIIEYIDGEVRVTSTDQPWQVCTNHVMWQKSEKECDEACSRYRAGSEAAERLASGVGSEDLRHVVRTMSVENWTMWTSVYDLTNRQMRVLYKTQNTNEYCDGLDI